MSSASTDEHHPKVNYRQKDAIGEPGRFGFVYKGKLEGELSVAIKMVEKKKTRVPKTNFYYNTMGHPNILNFFCHVAESHSKFV